LYYLWNMESLLVEKEVLSRQTEKNLKRAITFDPTVGSRSKFYTSFQRPFSSQYLWNPYSLKTRYGRARPE